MGIEVPSERWVSSHPGIILSSSFTCAPEPPRPTLEPGPYGAGCSCCQPSEMIQYSSMGTNYSDFFKRTLIVAAVVATPILIWYLFAVVLMALGAVILAMLLRLGARPLMRWIAFPESVALAVSG